MNNVNIWFRIESTQPTRGGAVTAVLVDCCANCVETPLPHPYHNNPNDNHSPCSHKISNRTLGQSVLLRDTHRSLVTECVQLTEHHINTHIGHLTYNKSHLHVPTTPAACGGTGSSVKRSANWSHPIPAIGLVRHTTTTQDW